MADEDVTAALKRATDAASVAAEASLLLWELRGLMAGAGVSVPADLETKLLEWLAKHVGK